MLDFTIPAGYVIEIPVNDPTPKGWSVTEEFPLRIIRDEFCKPIIKGVDGKQFNG